MRSVLIGVVVLAVLIGGLFMGVTALLFAPLFGAIVLGVLLVWMLRRRLQHRPPIE